jgi:alpha-beta hydrolase superfamily lysophospholipase
MTFISSHSKGGVSALLYCTQYDTKIKKVCTWASPFDTVRGIQNLGSSGELMVFSTLKMLEQTK